MKCRSRTFPLIVVILLLVLPVLIGCASGATYVEATPEASPQLTMPDPHAPSLE